MADLNPGDSVELVLQGSVVPSTVILSLPTRDVGDALGLIRSLPTDPKTAFTTGHFLYEGMTMMVRWDRESVSGSSKRPLVLPAAETFALSLADADQLRILARIVVQADVGSVGFRAFIERWQAQLSSFIAFLVDESDRLGAMLSPKELAAFILNRADAIEEANQKFDLETPIP